MARRAATTTNSSSRSPKRSAPPSAGRRERDDTSGPHTIPITYSGAITRPLKTSEAVARDVVRGIVDQRLEPGDSLPPEAAMLEEYRVSRESLREGLRLLEVQGLITIRRGPGGGPMVGTVDPANLGRVSTLFYTLSGATYGELFDAWVWAESTLAERAARNPDISARRSALERYLTAATSDHRIEDFVESHAEFHGAVGSLARNRVLELSLLTMGLIVSHHVPLDYDPRTLGAAMDHEHREIAAAIIAGHPGRARQLMWDHIQAVADVSTEAMGSAVDDVIEWH